MLNAFSQRAHGIFIVFKVTPLLLISPSREETGIDLLLIFRAGVPGEEELYTPLQVYENSVHSAFLDT